FRGFARRGFDLEAEERALRASEKADVEQDPEKFHDLRRIVLASLDAEPGVLVPVRRVGPIAHDAVADVRMDQVLPPDGEALPDPLAQQRDVAEVEHEAEIG